MSSEYKGSDVQIIKEALEDAVWELSNRGASDGEIRVAVKEALGMVFRHKNAMRRVAGAHETIDDLPFC